MTVTSGMRARKRRVEVSGGGTGASTAMEARVALNVPGLGDDNVWTGANSFGGAVTTNDDNTHTGNNDFQGLVAAEAGLFLGGAIAVRVVTKTGTYTATVGDVVINCTGTWTLTLPTAATVLYTGLTGSYLLYVIKNSGAGVITLACTGGQTIDGSATQALIAAASLTVVSDGANWIIV